MIQSVAADLLGLSQPTIARLSRRLVPVIDEALSITNPETLILRWTLCRECSKHPLSIWNRAGTFTSEGPAAGA